MVFLFLTAGAGESWAAKVKSKSSGNPKYASIVIDTETGVILSQRYADKVVHPASLTKMMTLLLAFEALDARTITLRDRMTVSQKASKASPSKLDLRAGSAIRVEDAIYALVTKSANDVAVVMAEYLGGTEPRFATLMTQRARDIGMTKTTFKNASGLPDSGQVSTARDMATLARYMLIRYPNYYHYFGTKQFVYQGKTHGNHNKLLHSYPGMDGFKTGYINASGFNLVASAKRDGRRLIGVVFGGQTSKTRNDHMVKILNEGFSKAGKMKDMRVAAVAPPPMQQMPARAAAPVPPRKPSAPGSAESRFGSDNGSYTSLSGLQKQVAPTAVHPPEMSSEDRMADIKKSVQRGEMSELTGQGDIDPAEAKRIETGMLAMAMHKGQHAPAPIAVSAMEDSLRASGQDMIAQIAATLPPAEPMVSAAPSEWSIQIGAYASRVVTDDTLRQAISKLPQDMRASVKPVSVPLRTASGTMFRARLTGMTQGQAAKACGYFNDCITISPAAQQAAR